MKLYKLLEENKFDLEQTKYILKEIENSDELMNYSQTAPNFFRLAIMIEKVKARFSDYDKVKGINFKTINWEYIFNTLKSKN